MRIKPLPRAFFLSFFSFLLEHFEERGSKDMYLKTSSYHYVKDTSSTSGTVYYVFIYISTAYSFENALRRKAMAKMYDRNISENNYQSRQQREKQNKTWNPNTMVSCKNWVKRKILNENTLHWEMDFLYFIYYKNQQNVHKVLQNWDKNCL